MSEAVGAEGLPLPLPLPLPRGQAGVVVALERPAEREVEGASGDPARAHSLPPREAPGLPLLLVVVVHHHQRGRKGRRRGPAVGEAAGSAHRAAAAALAVAGAGTGVQPEPSRVAGEGAGGEGGPPSRRGVAPERVWQVEGEGDDEAGATGGGGEERVGEGKEKSRGRR